MTNKAFDTAANAASSREHFASRIGFILIAAASPTSPVNTAEEHSCSYTWCFW